jgi:putative two-component system response regulator
MPDAYNTQRSSFQHTILVVDDAPENIELLASILQPTYRVRVALGGAKAVKIVLSEQPPDLVLLDIMMPEMDGYEVCRQIKSVPERHNIPILFVTAMEDQADEARGLEIGADDYITKPYSAPIILARIKAHLALYDQNRELEKQVDERTRELQETRMQIIHRLGRAAEFRDNETGLHVVRMAHFSRLIAIAAGMSESLTETLFLAAPMHDVGKIGIPDNILLKPGKLDAPEWHVMKTHTTVGAEILGEHPDPLLSMARLVALSHHEKWDGSGYPHGLVGEAIPLVGRIVAIADVFDALTSERPYKLAWEISSAVEYILSGAGGHFDPYLTQCFSEALPQILEVRERFSDRAGEQPAGH